MSGRYIAARVEGQSFVLDRGAPDAGERVGPAMAVASAGDNTAAMQIARALNLLSQAGEYTELDIATEALRQVLVNHVRSRGGEDGCSCGSTKLLPGDSYAAHLVAEWRDLMRAAP